MTKLDIQGGLKREVEVALNDSSIYDIGSYGWVSENDPDPEFIGHAAGRSTAVGPERALR